MKIIFGSRFSRAKSFSGNGGKLLRFPGVPARRGWKRTALLVLVPVSLFAIAVTDHGNSAIGKVIRREIIAALEDPLNLLAERSPGGRGPRVLLSIKGPLTGPHERVLSTVREREMPLGIAPAVDNSERAAVPQAVASIPIAPPEYDTPPHDQIAGLPPFSPFFPTTQFGYPNIPPGEAPPPPPGGPVSPPVTTGPPPDAVVIVLPEPATWAMMILGLFAIGAATRRRKQAGLSCKQ